MCRVIPIQNFTSLFGLGWTVIVTGRLQLHGAVYLPDSFVMMLRYCSDLKAIRYESMSLNRIAADKSHRVIVALGNLDDFYAQKECAVARLAINLKFEKSMINVTPATFYEISNISHICSIFRKSVCIRVVHYSETPQVLSSLCF